MSDEVLDLEQVGGTESIRYRIDNRLYDGHRSDGQSCWTWAVDDLEALIAEVESLRAELEEIGPYGYGGGRI